MKTNFLKSFSVFFTIITLAVLLGTNCDQPKQEEDITKPSLVGLWVSSAKDGFEVKIDASTDGSMFYYYDEGITRTLHVPGNGCGFDGIIVNKPDYTATSGYITVKIVDPDVTNDIWKSTISYPSGKYTVVAWNNFNGSTCKEASPFKLGGYPSYKDTQAEAEAEFTEANGYYGWSYITPYTKQ